MSTIKIFLGMEIPELFVWIQMGQSMKPASCTNGTVEEGVRGTFGRSPELPSEL
jgi:hypothetical protein